MIYVTIFGPKASSTRHPGLGVCTATSRGGARLSCVGPSSRPLGRVWRSCPAAQARYASTTGAHRAERGRPVRQRGAERDTAPTQLPSSRRRSCNVVRESATSPASFHPRSPSLPPAEAHSLRVEGPSAGDSKSPACNGLAGSSPASGTTIFWALRPLWPTHALSGSLATDPRSCEDVQRNARSWRSHVRHSPTLALCKRADAPRLQADGERQACTGACHSRLPGHRPAPILARVDVERVGDVLVFRAGQGEWYNQSHDKRWDMGEDVQELPPAPWHLALEAAIADASSGICRLVIDATEMTWLVGQDWGFLLRLFDRMRDAELGLVLVTQERVSRAHDLLGLGERIQTSPSIEDAVDGPPRPLGG